MTGPQKRKAGEDCSDERCGSDAIDPQRTSCVACHRESNYNAQR